MKKAVIGTIAAVCLSVIAAASAAGQEQKSAAAQSIEKLDMSAVPDLDRDTVRRVQTALRAKGFDPGPIDGVAAGETKDAVKKFQDRFGIKATGSIDNQTLFALGIVGNKAAAVEEEPHARPEPKEQRKKAQKAHRAPPSATQRGRRSVDSGTRSRTSYCANYNNGSRNCGFSSFQQCLAAISGVGGSCQAN
jgi:peptidoglycan hydrolase-like protein with peptidoglycan-binding domain